MRRIRFTLVCLTVLLSGCNEALKNTDSANGQGEVYIALSSEPDNREPETKAGDNISSHLGDFTVEIANSAGICLYREKFSDAEGTAVPLNTGMYTLTAEYGSPKTAGFNAIYYRAEEKFEVHPQTHEEISAVAKMAKIKVAVQYINLLEADESDYFMDIEYGTGNDVVTFSKTEKRAAYIPAGYLIPIFHYNLNGVWKIYRAEPVEGSPNDFITFTVDIDPTVNPDEGTASISVTVDTSVEVIEKELETEYIVFTGKGPQMDIISDSPGNTELRVYPDQRAGKHKARVDVYAPDRIEKCILEIESPYLENLGIPATVDLAEIDNTVGDLLWNHGIRWFKDMKGRRLTYVDLEGYATHIAAMKYDPDAPKDANFKIIVEDMNGQSAETSFARFIEVKPEFSFEAYQFNAYATKIIGVQAKLKMQTGNPESLILECISSEDPNFSDWRRVEIIDHGEFDTDEENINVYADVLGLKPETSYRMRLRYRNSDKLTKYQTLTTEAAQQVGNAGFEDWSEESFHSKTIYLPYLANSSEKWWDSNSKETTNNNYSQPYKAFPTVWYTDGRDGGKAAIITAISHGAFNSGVTGPYYNRTQGELFIGTYGGNKSHSFSSRPSAVKFWYKYAPYESDTWEVDVNILNGTTIIGKGHIENSSQTSSWTECTVNIAYSDRTLKATNIYVRFLQSTNSNPNVRFINMATPQGEVNIGAGSQLTIDDIEMIY